MGKRGREDRVCVFGGYGGVQNIGAVESQTPKTELLKHKRGASCRILIQCGPAIY